MTFSISSSILVWKSRSTILERLYSSLDYLEAYRVNRVKIPCAMIDTGATDPEASAMIWAIMDLGQKLGIDVVAQRIETREQLGLMSGATPSAKAQGFFSPRQSRPSRRRSCC
jgi:EAL domain-containing protein (putative c-di-GMP-specific phosphodiesterase class I)